MISVNALSSVEDLTGPASADSPILPDLNQAEAYLSIGLISEAADLFSAFMETPDSPRAHMGLAQCAYFRRDLHEALGHLQVLEQRDPGYPNLYNNMGVVLFEMGIVEEAKDKFLKAAHSDPNNLQPWHNLMDLAFSSEDYVTCREYCQKILQLDPDDAEAQECLARLLEHSALPETAASPKAQDTRKVDFAAIANSLHSLIDVTRKSKPDNYCPLTTMSIAPEPAKVEPPTSAENQREAVSVATWKGAAPGTEKISPKGMDPSLPPPSCLAKEGARQTTTITGVVIRSLTTPCDDRGYRVELVQAQDLPSGRLSSISLVGHFMAGTVRAFHRHAQTWESIMISQGSAKLVLVDDRAESSTRGKTQILISGERNPIQITIPPGVYHGWMALSDGMQLIIAASEPFVAVQEDEECIPADSFGDFWTLKIR